MSVKITGMELSSSESSVLKWLSLGLLLLQNSLNPIVFRYATTEFALEDKFSTPVCVTVQELLKLLLSCALYFHEIKFSVPALIQGLRTDVVEQPYQAAKLAIPAGVYFVQNMALQVASANLPAAVFQVLYNGKTLVVALFSVALLNKQLSRAKWLALGLMGLGLALVQVGAGEESKQTEMGNSRTQSILVGLGAVIFGCTCSGFAGVYFEMMMKPQPLPDGSVPPTPSMWMKNMQLAFFSLVVGALQIMGSGAHGRTGGVFAGFTPRVWMLVWNNALGGLLVAMVIKHADNILKGFACALATVFATLLSVPLFGYQIGLLFMVGVLTVVYSTLVYGGTVKIPEGVLTDPDKELQFSSILRNEILKVEEESLLENAVTSKAIPVASNV